VSVFKSMKNIKPLSQDNLGKYANERGVHEFEERSFLTPMMPGSAILV
jgi:hypothetical protein